MIYPGDVHYFVLPLLKAGGGDPDVTSDPTITVIHTLDNAALTGHVSQPMTLIPGTQKVYTYRWDTTGLNDGVYLALIDYAAEEELHQGQLLEVVQLGDSRIRGLVALEATTAKQDVVAKDATVMKKSDFVHPNDASSIQFIKSKVGGLPANVASAEALEDVRLLAEKAKDASLGTWSINKTTNILTMYRENGTELARFQLVSHNDGSTRTRL